MIKTLNVKSNGSFEVNFGSYEVSGFVDDIGLPEDFLNKLSEIQSAILSGGFSEIHIETSEFRSFEHLRKSGAVIENSFGEAVSQANFDWIMQQKDAVDFALNPPPPPPEPEPEPALEVEVGATDPEMPIV
jgi:hypothetical protein